jgi:hypothetical protein
MNAAPPDAEGAQATPVAAQLRVAMNIETDFMPATVKANEPNRCTPAVPIANA